jgi:glycolate oxidase FAD binding subunit
VTAAVGESVRSSLASACQDLTDATAADAVDGVAPALVARPASTAETAEVLRAAAAHDLAVVARGRGTKLTWGRPPERVDLLLDTKAMDQVVDHAAGDLVVVTQAGTRLSDVQQAVAGAGQRLAIDETVPGASVGGTVATATSGPGRLLAGTVRDLLIGVTVVRADGVVAKAGGRVVKNVAGYDLGKLVTGSFGTLAVLTEAVFRLHPLPAARRFVSAAARSPAEAHRLVQAVTSSQVVPSSVEIDWPAAGSGTVTVALAGTEGGVAARTETTLALLTPLADQGTRDHDISVDADPPAWWGRYPWSGAESGGGQRATALKLTFAVSGLPTVLQAARSCPVPLRLNGSAGAGVLYGALAADTPVAAVAETVQRLRAVCEARGGALVVLDAPADVKQSGDTWGPVPALELMRRVKQQFDPGRRLAPGRFVGGI